MPEKSYPKLLLINHISHTQYEALRVAVMVQNSARTTNGGEGSSASPSASTIATTLDDVMRAPAVIAPDVVVLDTTHREKERGKGLNPKEDLWLTSADG